MFTQELCPLPPLLTIQMLWKSLPVPEVTPGLGREWGGAAQKLGALDRPRKWAGDTYLFPGGAPGAQKRMDLGLGHLASKGWKPA